jgi:hypothetical protein
MGDCSSSTVAGRASTEPQSPLSLGHTATIDYREIFDRAGEIAKQRYPNGCPSATILGNIVREAADDLLAECARRMWRMGLKVREIAESLSIDEYRAQRLLWRDRP